MGLSEQWRAMKLCECATVGCIRWVDLRCKAPVCRVQAAHRAGKGGAGRRGAAAAAAAAAVILKPGMSPAAWPRRLLGAAGSRWERLLPLLHWRPGQLLKRLLTAARSRPHIALCRLWGVRLRRCSCWARWR